MINTSDRGNQNELVFLLGAGASVEAGVPDTRKFIDGKRGEGGIQGFLEWLKESNKQTELEILEKILVMSRGIRKLCNLNVEMLKIEMYTN